MMRFRLIQPPLRRAIWLWPASLALTLGLFAWISRVGELAPGTGALETLGAPLLLLWLLFHPRPRGLYLYGVGSPARDRLRLRAEPLAQARRHNKRLAGDYLRARIGPIWIRCAMGAMVVAWWLATLGWLRLEISPKAVAATALGANANKWLLIFALGSATCVSASHLCGWERKLLSEKRLPRLEAFAAFWSALFWAGLSQALAAIFSLLFCVIMLLFAGYASMGYAVVSSYQEPTWLEFLTSPKRPRSELLLLALPGMFWQAWRDWAALRFQVTMRLSLLGEEVARERQISDEKAKARHRISTRPSLNF